MQPLVFTINTNMKCKWPSNHVSISSTGKYRPCCAWEEQDDQVDIATNSIDDYLNSKFYKNLMADMKADKFAVGCTECILDEKAGIEGMVQTGESRYPDQEEFNLNDMEIKFGNVCNAGCIMCSAYNSSLLESENKSNPELEIFRVFSNSAPIKWFENDDKFKEIVQFASKAKRIRFTGGEPTVRGLLDEFLHQLVELNPNIYIQITSNGSSFSKRLQETLKKFVHVSIHVSIDAYGKANDFIRWPLTWNKIERNVDKMLEYNNVWVYVETSLQAGGIDSIPQLIEWCNTRKIEWSVNSVYKPEHLQPFLAQPHIIEKAKSLNNKKLNKLLEFNSTQDDYNDLREKMINYYDTLSAIRKIDWKECLDV